MSDCAFKINQLPITNYTGQAARLGPQTIRVLKATHSLCASGFLTTKKHYPLKLRTLRQVDPALLSVLTACPVEGHVFKMNMCHINA